jgi:geranylgeranyl diphosphate synthase, type II
MLMADTISTSPPVDSNNIGAVPQDATVRGALRQAAETIAASLNPQTPPLREALDQLGRALLEQAGLPLDYLGFAMVTASNAFWAPQFGATRPERRLLFLPRCLRDREHCQANIDSLGLHCAGCGRCVIHDLKERAEHLGYRVIVAEGTPSVVSELLGADIDAVLGVACLDSLEKAFDRVADLGVPYIAVPLLRDGCVDTTTDLNELHHYLGNIKTSSPERSRSYIPLMRAGSRIFEPDALMKSLADLLPAPADRSDTDRIALDWLAVGGKRFRPFVTLAAYAVSRHGAKVLAHDIDLDGLLPPAVKHIALAIEVLHKASLVHDDIEDEDAYRYGVETMHRTYGVGPAINIGDYLIGLGYRVVAAQAGELGAACVADILGHMTAAHLDLCRGQGAELLWSQDGSRELRPIEALGIYALKTSPAFETALYAGLRCADADINCSELRKFAVYVGEAYQLLNDLDDWNAKNNNKVCSASDVLAGRPTLLQALALQAGPDAGRLKAAAGDADSLKALYQELGVFEKAEALVRKLRERATELAENTPNRALGDLMLFLVRTLL